MKTGLQTKKFRSNNIAANNPVNILHRYYIWANRMRLHFEEIIMKHTKQQIDNHTFRIESIMYMSQWYGLLYVVIEGWESLRLSDNTIDNLLKSPNNDLLKRYRNAVFHYPKKRQYNDKRFEAFFKEQTTVKWIRSLNLEFGRYFIDTLKNNKNKT